MARKSNQQIRREELIDAAQDAVAQKGLAAVQLRDIAQLAELTPGAILYYYDDLHDLLRQVYERATQRYSVQREQAIAEIASPALQLGTLLQMSAPSGPDDAELRILFEFDAMIFRSPRNIEYARQYLQRQVEMYRDLLQDGVDAGVFKLRTSATDTARNLLALEDSHGFSVLIGELTTDDMVRLLYDAAAAATGIEPADLVAVT